VAAPAPSRSPEELTIILSAARLGMSRFSLDDPAWRLFQQIWNAAARMSPEIDQGIGIKRTVRDLKRKRGP
jgi:hypothetical protein